MSDPSLKVAAAEAEAAAARARLTATAGELQARLSPAQLVDDARRAGLNAAQAGVEQVRRNPAAAAGIVAAAGVILNRRRLLGLFRKSSSPSPKGHRS